MEEFVVKYWLQTLFTGVVTILGFGLRKVSKEVKKEMSDQRSIKIGVQAILRDRLIQSYNYHIELGCCAIHDRDNIINMYNQYHTLGANGVIDGLMDDLLNLPIKVNCTSKQEV